MSWQDRDYHREEAGGGYPQVRLAWPPFTRLTIILIAVCFGIYVLQQFVPAVDTYGALTYRHAAAWKQPWRFVTYQYLHGGPAHLIFNLLALYFFLPAVEGLWGWKRALAFYTVGGVIAGLCHGLLSWLVGGNAGLIGASGSIFAIMGACALFFPEKSLILLLFPVPIRVAVAILAILFTLVVISGGRDGVSDAAHLGGLAFGWFGPLIWVKWGRKWGESYRMRRASQLIEDEREELERVDAILQKVSEHGMNSLTWSERRALKKATERQRKRDEELERIGKRRRM